MTFVSSANVQACIRAGSWRALEKLAAIAVDDAAKRSGSEFKPVLGGGTRLMLAMQHRISDDIDLFIRDPQWIGYLTPRLSDCLEGHLLDYSEDQTALKLRFSQGEIDFIVSMSLLGLPNEPSAESRFELEPVAEVLAKKLFYRGWMLTPRDLFDWRQMEEHLPAEVVHADDIAMLLTGRFDLIEGALKMLGESPVNHMRWNKILTPHLPDLRESIDWGRGRLQQLRELHDDRRVVNQHVLEDEPSADTDDDSLSPGM